MKARIVSSARLREPSLQERFAYYQKLLRNRLPVELFQVKKSGVSSLLPKRSRVIALDESGDALTSREMAARLTTFERQNIPSLVFIIGEADGLTDHEREVADESWSLSKLTLPHQMCMVMLAEQLYRSTAIQRNEPYHRD